MAEVQSHREMNQQNFENKSPLAPEAPTVLERDELGPNPFEDSWTHDHVLRPQTEGDEPDAGDMDAAAEQANAEAIVETQPGETGPDDQDTETDEPQSETPNPDVALLRQQNADLQARLARLEAQVEPKDEQVEVDDRISWDTMELPPLPDELAEYSEPIAKQIIAVAEHVWNHAQNLSQRALAQQQAAATQDSLKTQINDMVSDPAYADYETYYPRMKEIAQAAPAMLQQPNGLKAIYFAAKGELPSARPAANGNGAANGDDAYARGMKAGMASVQGRRASAVDTPGPVAADTRVITPADMDLEHALEFHFKNAVAKEVAKKR